jgi:hypothetical protein
MKISELFEDIPGQPGLMAIPNIPTGNSTNINKSTVTTNNNSGNTSITANTQPITNTINPQINKGTIINVPVGPNHIKTPLKINSVDSTTKTATLINPIKPNDPGISYSQADLSNWLTNQNK